jgi:hypothetical protein
MANGKVQFDAGVRRSHAQAELLRPMMADVSRELNEPTHGANLLFEGAQGTLLDVDHGTYPYVTSSNCVAGNAAAGSGVGPACCTMSWASPRPIAPAWAVARSRPNWTGKRPGHAGLPHEHRGRRKGRDHRPQPPLWLV